MTILVLEVDSLPVASSSWTVCEMQRGTHGIEDSWLEVGVLGIEPVFRMRFNITMPEFLALIADGGKIVDLRKLQQESK